MNIDVYPRSIPGVKWPAAVFRSPAGFDHKFKPPKQPQGTIKQCVPSSVTWCVEFRRSALGMSYVDLSAADLFGRVPSDQNGTWIGDVLKEAIERGIGLTSISGEVYQPNMVPTPDEFRECFKSTWYDGNFDFAAAFSAVCEDRPVVCGVGWKLGYKYLDKDGWLIMDRAAGDLQGHAIAAYGPAVRYVNNRIEYGLKCWNPLGNFSPLTGSCFILPESKFAADRSDFWICDSVTQL